MAKQDKQVHLAQDSSDEIAALNDKIISLQETAKRVQADYKNASRRFAEERIKLLKFASQDLIEQLLQPLEHLSLASEQLNDSGLAMVIDQLWQTLKSNGLTEIDVLGKTFDVTTMEAVEKEDKGEKVIKVVKKGYELHGKVIQHAKVVLD